MLSIMPTYNVQKSFALIFFLIALSSEAIRANLINFGGPSEDSNAAAYYLMADNDSVMPHPNADLKRTQRSFWKKLFKNGLFGEDDCDNCNYDVGNGNNYNMPFPGLQPFNNLQDWKPFQPLFGDSALGCRYQNCNNNNYANSQGTPSYNNNIDVPSAYQEGSPVAGNSYGSQEKQVQNNPSSYSSPEPSLDTKYETISDAPKKYENNAYNGKTAYAKNDKNYSKTEKPYSKGVTSSPSYDKSKIPQILYQPIIYVSPELKDCTLVKSGESCVKLKQPNNGNYNSLGFQHTYPAKQAQKYEEAYDKNTPSYITPMYSKGSPSVASYNQPCALHSPPTVSTVSTIYTVITPSKNPADSTHNGPSKYSLFQPGGISTPMYGHNEQPPSYNNLGHVPTQLHSCPAPLEMTTDDQPYRICPELFDEYNRHLNKATTSQHHGHQQNPGNTFINTQLINI